MISLLATMLMTRANLGPKMAKLASWGILIALAALLIGGAVWWFSDTVDDAHDAGVEQGVTTERVEAQAEVINNVEKANETRAAASDPGSCVAYNECLRSARNTANCVRYMPHDAGCPVRSRTGAGDR